MRGARLKLAQVVEDMHDTPCVVRGLSAPRWSRIRTITLRSAMNAISWTLPPQRRQRSGSTPPGKTQDSRQDAGQSKKAQGWRVGLRSGA